MAQRIYPVRPSAIRNIGIVLFCVSYILPSGHAAFVPTMGEHANDYLKPFGGGCAFVNTPAAITFMPLWRGPPLDDGFTSYEIFSRVVLFGAWLANFTVFFRLPTLAAWFVIVLPWAAFVCWFDLAVPFIPFYFWAPGITFIHISRILRSRIHTALKPATEDSVSF